MPRFELYLTQEEAEYLRIFLIELNKDKNLFIDERLCIRSMLNKLAIYAPPST